MPFWDITRSVQSDVIVLSVTIACDFVCQTLCLTLVLSQNESNKPRYEIASTLFCGELLWVS